MAVRLQMKLGVVPAPDRSPDSPDTVVVVEPTVGSVARSKGGLYLLVTSVATNARARETTRLAAETIRDEYYYDESAGIRVCIEKAISLANKRLAHQHDRLGMPGSDKGGGPVGVAVAVVRGGELYVATVGPAEAYLIRGARLSTLPDPHRDRGLPSGDLEPEVWRGEISVGDSLVLVSPNVVSRLGPDDLKDALVTLHPQSAMEHLHHAFVAAGGSGSDGAIAIEAAEVAATHKQRTLVPVRPDEPLAGAPDRSPIPLADSLTDGVAAVQAGASRARVAAGGVAWRALARLQDLLPRKDTAGGRVTSYSARRETQRRAAVALLAFVLVAGGLGLALSVLGGSGPRAELSSLTVGQRAVDQARQDIDSVSGQGRNLVADDPGHAQQLLTDASQQLDLAEKNGIAKAVTGPLRAQIAGGLDALSAMVDVAPHVLFTFPAAAKSDLGALVIGSDGAPYVLDRASKAVYRIDLKSKKAAPILRAGQVTPSGVKVGTPRFLTTGGQDVLVLDDRNVLWRWRPANQTGRGTLARIPVRDGATWGNDILAVGTFNKNAGLGLYNLYVVDPSEQEVLAYSPAADGSGYPASANRWLAAARDVSTFRSLYIDGDLFVCDAGVVRRFVSGRSEGWTAAPPGGSFSAADSARRPAPAYSLVTSGSDRRTGSLYAYDPGSARVVAFDKASGSFQQQFRIAAGGHDWADMRGFVVQPGQGDGPATMLWIEAGQLETAVLEAAPAPAPGASGSPAPSGSHPPSGSPRASMRPSPSP